MSYCHFGVYCLLLISLFMGPILGAFDLRISPQTFISRAISSNDGEVSCPPPTYDYTERYVPRNGSMVSGYPSSGGVLFREAGAVELLHLGLDRFKEAKRSANAAEEDAFCKMLGQIGATWWSSKAEWSDAIIGKGDAAKMAKIVQVGWPSSGRGVWVLEYLEDNQEMTREASSLNLCLNMDERCKIIEELGGTFYSDADACKALRPLPEETLSIRHDEEHC